MALRHIAKPDEAYAPCPDVSALGDQTRGPADVLRFYVAHARIDVEAVACRDGQFILHVKLRVGSAAAGFGWRRSDNFHAGRGCSCREQIVIQKTLRQRRASVGLDMHGITNCQWSTRLESDNAYGTDVCRQMQCLTVSGLERSRAVNRRARAWLSRLGRIPRTRLDGAGAKTQAWPEGAGRDE